MNRKRNEPSPCAWESQVVCNAGFQTCCIADFQVGRPHNLPRAAGLETRDAADLEVCATTGGTSPREKMSLPTDPLNSRREFLRRVSLTGSAIGFAGAGALAQSPSSPPRNKALIAITLDLEMARNLDRKSVV